MGKRSGENRAVQFSAYRALKGYEEMVAEYTREREARIILSEESSEILSEQLKALSRGDAVTVKYYRKDAYASAEGIVRECSAEEQMLRLNCGSIPFRDLLYVLKKEEKAGK